MSIPSDQGGSPIPVTAPAQTFNYVPGAGTTSASATGVASTPASHWYDPLYEHYTGHLPSGADVSQLNQGGWNYDRLYQHLRAQPSWVHGLTIGALEDYHKVAEPSFFKWTGREPSDQDIRELVNHGVKTGDDIEKYLTNRPDVVAAHPGAPVGLTDTAFGQHKAAINSQYQSNLERDATDQEARDAYAQASSPFRKAPPEQVGLSAGVGASQGNLISQAQIAPNSRGSQ